MPVRHTSSEKIQTVIQVMALFCIETTMTRKVRMVRTVEILTPDLAKCMKQHALLTVLKVVHGMEWHDLLAKELRLLNTAITFLSPC